MNSSGSFWLTIFTKTMNELNHIMYTCIGQGYPTMRSSGCWQSHKDRFRFGFRFEVPWRIRNSSFNIWRGDHGKGEIEWGMGGAWPPRCGQLAKPDFRMIFGSVFSVLGSNWAYMSPRGGWVYEKCWSRVQKRLRRIRLWLMVVATTLENRTCVPVVATTEATITFFFFFILLLYTGWTPSLSDKCVGASPTGIFGKFL